jgi:hypothetical protein
MSGVCHTAQTYVKRPSRARCTLAAWDSAPREMRCSRPISSSTGTSCEDHNKQAQLIVSPYYKVLARVITYHGWPSVQHRELTQEIDRLLPGLFPATDGDTVCPPV